MQPEMLFEWDEDKAASNLRKHKTQRKHKTMFKDATLAFSDPNRTTVPDQRFDDGEERLGTFGYMNNRLFMAVLTPALGFGVVRIISARKADAREGKRYGVS